MLISNEEIKGSKNLHYKSFFSDSYSIMLIIDPSNGKIVDANKAASDYYGYSIEEIRKMNINQINTLPKEEIFKEMQNAKNAFRNKFYFKHRLANNEIRDVEVYSGKVSFDKSTYLYSIIYDITERKKTEQNLKESQSKLKISNHEKDKMFSIISHDLKGSLGTILGFSKILSQNFDKYDSLKQKEYLTVMHKGLDNSYKLLENLLLWSRSKRGIMEFNPEKLNLRNLTNKTILQLQQFYKNKSIEITNKISENINVEADKNSLSAIIRKIGRAHV